MRVFKYDEATQKKILKEVYCNNCGKKIKVENEIIKEGVMSIDYKWEYFSEKDGEEHSFDLCEHCYDVIVEKFKHPVLKNDYTELL